MEALPWEGPSPQPPPSAPLSAATAAAAAAAETSPHGNGGSKQRRPPSPPLPLPLLLPPAFRDPHVVARLGWAALAVTVAAAYLALALQGGLVALLLRLNRWGGPRDIYAGLPSHGRAYGLAPFTEMFLPPYVSPDRPRRSLAVFTAGRDGLANVDSLVRQWGHEHLDYLICHYDESQAEWAALPWYRERAVGFYAHRQGKMWFFRRALTPALVQEYEYVHFIDSDAGSPTDPAAAKPFQLWAYEQVLRTHQVAMGQPAVVPGPKSSVHAVCRQQPGSLLRWTTFVENGPLFSVHVRSGAFAAVWEMVDPLSVSGYGVDLAWCAYLYEQKGFDRARTCAVVDAHAIEHLDSHAATSQVYGTAPAAGPTKGTTKGAEGDGGDGVAGRQLDYYTWGWMDVARYARVMRPMLQDWKRKDELRRVPLPKEEEQG